MLAKGRACSFPSALEPSLPNLSAPPYLAGHSHDDGLTFSFVQLVEPIRERASAPLPSPTPFSAGDQGTNTC